MDGETKATITLDVYQSLVNAGWQPGVRRKEEIETHGLELFPLAAGILQELHGIDMQPLEQEGPWLSLNVEFHTSLVRGLEDQIVPLGRLLGMRLFPIGELTSLAVVLIAESGEVFLLGYDAPGVYFAGWTFGQALERIAKGLLANPLRIHGDVKGTFTMDVPDDEVPNVVVVPATGFIDVHGENLIERRTLAPEVAARLLGEPFKLHGIPPDTSFRPVSDEG